MNSIKALGQRLGFIKKPKEDDVAPPWLLCPHCDVKIHRGNPPKKVRESHQLTHYLCKCGGVSHWLDVMVMVLVGFGRYRKVPTITTATPRQIDEFAPNRILPHEVLWLCTRTQVVYLFKKNALCRLTLDKLPRSIDGLYRMEILEVGRRIRLDKTMHIYDGFQFVRTNYTESDDSYIYYSDVDFGDVIHQFHTGSPNRVKGIHNE